jgi:hypothetical protein
MKPASKSSQLETAMFEVQAVWGSVSQELPGTTWEGAGQVGFAGQAPAMTTGQLHVPSVHVHWTLGSDDVLPQKSTVTVPRHVCPSSLQAVPGVPTTVCEGQPLGPPSPESPSPEAP